MYVDGLVDGLLLAAAKAVARDYGGGRGRAIERVGSVSSCRRMHVVMAGR